MNPALLQQPIFQVTIPLMVTFVGAIWVASWSQNKRFEDLNKRFDDFRSEMNRRLDEIVTRLDRIERKLDDHEQRIVRLEERTSPFAKR